jgi:metal-dependent amidase/aminoacylase/carboxypeptidase family protein
VFYVRAAELDYLAALKQRVIACAEAAATATGASVKVTDLAAAYEPLRRNDALLDAFRANWRALGVQESEPAKDRYGSSDVGNVSQVVPTIQPLVKIARDGTPIHSRAFEKEAVTPMARDHGDDRRRLAGRSGPARAREGGVPNEALKPLSGTLSSSGVDPAFTNGRTA